MSTFSLDSLRKEVEKRYAPTIIKDGKEEFVLPNLLQLSEKARNEATALIEKIEKTSEDPDVTMDEQFATFREIVRVIEKNGRGQDLLDRIGDNIPLLLDVVMGWMERTQVGEAKAS